MSDEFERDSDSGITSNEFDIHSLNVESTDPLTSEFTPPNVKGTKPRWWESAPRSGAKRGERRSRKERPARETRRDIPYPRGGFRGPLTNVYTGIGMTVMPFDPGCGRIIIENAEKCAESLDELARTNPAVRRVLMSLITTSAWGAVIMAHAPIMMAIAMHHVPALRERQEKMVGEFAEMMANGFGDKTEEEDK